MIRKWLFRVIIAFFLFLPIESKAEMFRYTDESGAIHFVDEISLVPEKFRNQLIDAKPLPEINISTPVVKAEYRTLPQAVESNEKKQKKVEVFMTSWCPHCRKLIATLDVKKIRYQKYDIEKDAIAKAEYDAQGLKGVPVTRVGSHFISGNNPDAIMKVLYED